MDKIISAMSRRDVGHRFDSLPSQLASPHQSRASLLDLSPELLLMIAEEFQSNQRAVDRLGPLRLTCRVLHDLTTPMIYRRPTFRAGHPESFDEARHPVEMANVYKYTREISYLCTNHPTISRTRPIWHILDKVQSLRKFQYLPAGRFYWAWDVVYELSRVLLFWERGALRQDPKLHIVGY